MFGLRNQMRTAVVSSNDGRRAHERARLIAGAVVRLVGEKLGRSGSAKTGPPFRRAEALLIIGAPSTPFDEFAEQLFTFGCRG
jgi:hypothetical protein